MARLYSNENFPFDIVFILRQFGHDVLTSYDADQANKGIPDAEVLEFARNQDRIAITLNRDDFLDLHRSGVNHAGIIICKEDRDYVGQAQVVNELLQPTKTWANQLVRIKKRNQPGSARQIFVTQTYL
ncbi:MAG: DUF5615 family PIN-like protein [Cyanobacteria bacterium P01_F01_bin.86]